MKTIQYALSEDGVATVTFNAPGAPVNTLCQQWLQDLGDVTALVLKNRDAIKGIILASAKSTFFAGADLHAVMRLQPADAPRAYAEVERLKHHFRTLETLGKPVVSCLNGTALGGGWEVALVGHHRVAVDDPKIQFGLPEVTLGLLPGAGGVTKMTRHLGLTVAQPYLLQGQLFGPREALALGLVHELVADASQLRASALAWIAENPNAQHPWDAKGYKIPGGTPADPHVAAALSVAPAMLKKQTRGLYPAPEAILACMAEGALVDMDTALRIESRYLAPLLTGANAKAMISAFFFDLNAVKSGQSRPLGFPALRPQKVGVLGAGMMGAGIAYAQALGKIPIVVNDARGFYTSRTFGAFVMEGAAMLGEGIPAAAIENAGMQAGMPVGPLAVLDETALSLSVQVLDQARADYSAQGKTYAAMPDELLVERMVKEFKRSGRAAGGGFYDYPLEKGGKKTLWPELKRLFEKPELAWDIQDLKDRLLYRQAVETARCLAEGVLTSVHEANIGSIFGIGFPAWTGGAIQFIYGMGVDAFLARCDALAARFGAGFMLTDAVRASIRQHQPVY